MDFKPIPEFVSSGSGGCYGSRLAPGMPPEEQSTVYASLPPLSKKQDFQGETSGWGRTSPEYRDYTYIDATLAPDGTAKISLDDGVYRSKGTGYEFRGTVEYRVDERGGNVVFYPETAVLDDGGWHIKRGPGGERAGIHATSRVKDDRSAGEVFADAFGGKRESHMVSQKSYTKLATVMWPDGTL
eukprot:CAMPEP_0118632546 /NCGR_PEP_ID=MMETSP0785-20121206/506_1 /TAXON_ID=91992 /ORGANISM="Bolidomonas pacifica, Strain CCMP 1866" /LENGTH=184 /DNA_ID=CAMNT_0006523331 /DNA_START=120 /DNA_END=671 /DNA_ORIENTATION=+